MNLTYQLAKQELLTSDNNRCQQFFENNQNYLELGYFYLLNKNLPMAKKEFEKVVEHDLRAHWAIFLVELLTDGKVSYYPSYFELRNFFEIDLDLLLTHYCGDYVQSLINYSDFLSSINAEICKYIGRVFYNNGFQDYAEIFFEQAKEKFYNDPELHYLIAELCKNKGEISNAIKSAETCLEVLPGYFPAQNLLKKLK